MRLAVGLIRNRGVTLVMRHEYGSTLEGISVRT